MTRKLPEEFLEIDGPGRRFVTQRTVRLGDVDPDDELRFDAIARYAQDLANDDAIDVALETSLHFVVRKTMVVVLKAPQFQERLTCTTFCNGVGGRWAGRQSMFSGEDGANISMSAVWVHVDPDSGRPRKLTDRFHEAYAASAQGKKSSAKLVHDLVIPADADSMAWPYRWADLDLLGHVNNASSWRPIEQLIHHHRLSRSPMVAEVEYRNPTPPDTDATLWWHRSQADDEPNSSQVRAWITDETGETTFTTALLRFPS